MRFPSEILTAQNGSIPFSQSSQSIDLLNGYVHLTAPSALQEGDIFTHNDQTYLLLQLVTPGALPAHRSEIRALSATPVTHTAEGDFLTTLAPIRADIAMRLTSDHVGTMQTGTARLLVRRADCLTPPRKGQVITLSPEQDTSEPIQARVTGTIPAEHPAFRDIRADLIL